VVAADHAGPLERAHAPQARRRGEPHPLGELDVRQPPVGLQLTQDCAIDGIHWQIMPQLPVTAVGKATKCPRRVATVAGVATIAGSAPDRTLSGAAGIGIAVGVYGISFGVLAVAAGLSAAQACVMSMLVFTGASQFAFVGVLAGGGGALASGSNASASGSSRSANGTAVVSDHRGPGGPGFRRGGFGLDNLASRLGVSETALENALKAIRDAKTPEQRRAELTQAFATALGKTPDQVTAALNSVLPDKPDRDRVRGQFAADLAKALGVDVAKVQAGLDKARQDFQGQQGRRDRRGNIDTVVNDIASATGVDAAKVRSALQSLRPHRPDRRDRRDRGDDIRQKLATALGVTTAQLDAAFDKVRTQARDQFATELAQRLNIDVQKVKDALPDGGGGFFGFGFGGHRHG